MKHEAQPSRFTIVGGNSAPPSDPGAAKPDGAPFPRPDDELESTVDLAKEPGLLGRLDALLNT